jgi:hypothetical protein
LITLAGAFVAGASFCGDTETLIILYSARVIFCGLNLLTLARGRSQVCLVFVIVYSRTGAIDGIFEGDGAMNSRTEFWSSGLALISRYYPFGFVVNAYFNAINDA